MEFLDVVNKRRSVRSYEDRPVPEDIIMQILDCGHRAPTGGNLQLWDFIVVTDEAIKKQVTNTTYRGNSFDITHPQEWIETAPVLIVVAGDRAKVSERYGQRFSDTVYLDCSAVIENMLLAAVNFGLGACYIIGFFEKLLANVLATPPSHEIVGFITLGYQKGEATVRSKIPLSDKIHYNQYGRRK